MHSARKGKFAIIAGNPMYCAMMGVGRIALELELATARAKGCNIVIVGDSNTIPDNEPTPSNMDKFAQECRRLSETMTITASSFNDLCESYTIMEAENEHKKGWITHKAPKP